jgi:hypothetical protein
MKVAPIQLQQLSFRRISVEVGGENLGAGEVDPIDKRLAFDGVLITTHVGLSPMDEEDIPGKSFLLTLQVVIDNKLPSDGDASKPPPYLVDIEAGAVIRVAKGAEALGDVEDIVIVNGTSLLWSAIREQVCNLTARMPLGMATLPTVHFQDLRKHAVASTAVPTKQVKLRASKRSAKATT